MKGSFLALEIVGVVLILFGTVFALQGGGMIGGSVMSGNSFWIYAGSVLAAVGLILAIFGFYLGSRTRMGERTRSTTKRQFCRKGFSSLIPEQGVAATQ